MAGTISPSSLESLGNAVLEAAKTINTRVVKVQLERFRAAHKAWLAAQGRTASARRRELDLRMTRGDLDAVQDAAVDKLVTALVGDGFSRINPLKTFGVPSPTRLKDMGDEAEARCNIALAAKVEKQKQAGSATKKAAQALAHAAQAVLDASKAVVPAAAASGAQRQQREALVGEWTKAYALLRMACKLEEESGGAPLFSTLFPRTKSPKKKQPAPAPDAPVKT